MSRTYSHSDSYSDSHSDSHSDSLAQSLTQQLYSAWQQAVANNKLINQFIATTDDTEGRWLQGDAIAFGIKHHNGQKHLLRPQPHPKPPHPRRSRRKNK